jgi:hypothetical protein
MDWEARSPKDVAILMLCELFGTPPRDRRGGPARTFPLTGFQESGARRAALLLDRWRGVVLADGVGLGKTFIALALVEEEIQRGGAVMVAVPAALRPMWRRLLRRLSFPASPPVHLLSHAQLSRGSYSPALAGRLALVVVDEAHRFRNAATRRHAALSELCVGARVVLITATPINNSPGDLYVLLRLFLADDAFVRLGVTSLHEVLSSVPPPAGSLRRVVREVVVRRTRSMLSDDDAVAGLEGPLGRFPRRATPHLVRFQDARIPGLVAGIASLELAQYPAPSDVLVRLGLLKRLESGATALARSLDRMSSFTESFVSALEAGRLLSPGPGAGRDAGEDRDPLQLALVDLVSAPCPPDLDARALLDSARRDANRLRLMLGQLRAADPKVAALRDLARSFAPDRSVVFTEFRDTAEAVWRTLSRNLPVARIDGAGSWLGARPASRSAILQRFAPWASGAPDPPERERVGVLVATDVIAEGMNLQDARHVVSYDLPWNPVRLMQRIGRVDRLGSPHTYIVPYLFLPATGLEDLLGLTRRLRAKLGSIADALGDDESFELLERLGGGGRTTVAAFRQLEAQDHDPVERLRLRWESLGPEMAASQACRDPHADGKSASAPGAQVRGTVVAELPPFNAEDGRSVAVVRHAGRAWLMEVAPDGSVHEAGTAATRSLARTLEAGPQESQPLDAPAAAEVERIVRSLHAHFRATSSMAHAPPPLRARDPAANLAGLVRRALAGPIAAAEPELVARAERVLEQLDRPLPASIARKARWLSRNLDVDRSPSSVLARIEELIGRVPPSSRPSIRQPTRASGGQETRVLALLLIGPERPLRTVDSGRPRR